MRLKTAAIDFETYYEDKVFGIETAGVVNYTKDPRFEAYLVTIVTDTGIVWAGNPADFDWHSITGKDWQWLHHNASFDEYVLRWLREQGIVPGDAFPLVTHCTADLCAYFGSPRALDKAALHLFKKEVSKSTRAAMSGKRWANMTDDFRKEAVNYAIGDSVWCLKFWNLLGDKWPEVEREISRHTRNMAWQGVPIDVETLDKYIPDLQQQVWEAGQNLPWYAEGDAKPLAPTALAAECRKVGIPPPTSLAKDSQECAAWEEKYGEQYPWVKSMQVYRSGNALLQKLQAMRARVYDGNFMNYGLMYFGASTTGRFSGAGGVNMQNLAGKLMFELNVRGLVKAPPGYVFINADLSQIEPRCLAHITEDTALLDAIRAGMAIYEAHARATMGWTGGKLKKENPSRYALAKARVLALGYGAGAASFQAQAATYGVFLSIEQADETVTDFRATTKQTIGKLWNNLGNGMKRAANLKEDFQMELPTGRIMNYRRPSTHGGLSAETVFQGGMMRRKWWGGSLTENLIQATAREIFARNVLAVEKLGLPVLFHVHDELTCLAREEDAQDALEAVLEVLRTPPDFMPDLPLDAEGGIFTNYPLK